MITLKEIKGKNEDLLTEVSIVPYKRRCEKSANVWFGHMRCRYMDAPFR